MFPRPVDPVASASADVIDVTRRAEANDDVDGDDPPALERYY